MSATHCEHVRTLDDEVLAEQIERLARMSEGLRKLAQMAVRATDGVTSPAFLPRLLADYKLADGRPRAELAAAMRRLRMAGKITVDTVGRYENRHPMTGLIAAKD